MAGFHQYVVGPAHLVWTIDLSFGGASLWLAYSLGWTPPHRLLLVYFGVFLSGSGALAPANHPKTNPSGISDESNYYQLAQLGVNN